MTYPPGTDERNRFYLPELDGLRLVAFMLVFIHHTDLFLYLPYLSVFHHFGWIGVDLFFALSAYLFGRLLSIEYQQQKTISFRNFYLRRVFRIFPLYFFVTLNALALTACLNRQAIDIFRIIGLITFTDNISRPSAGITLCRCYAIYGPSVMKNNFICSSRLRLWACCKHGRRKISSY